MKKLKQLVVNISMLIIFLFVIIQQSFRILSITLTPEVQKGNDFVFYIYLILFVFAVIVLGYFLPLLLIFEIAYTFHLNHKPIIVKENNDCKPLYKITYFEKPNHIKLQVFRC